MGKAAAGLHLILLLLPAIASLGLGLAHAAAPDAGRRLQIEGDVYCDTCRVKFITELSHKLPGATVRLECTNIETGNLTYTAVAVAGEDGRYNMTVTGDHEDDICELFAVKSPVAECAESLKDTERSRVVCTANDGMHDDFRYANPVGFMTAAALPECRSLLNGLDILPEDDE